MSVSCLLSMSIFFHPAEVESFDVVLLSYSSKCWICTLSCANYAVLVTRLAAFAGIRFLFISTGAGVHHALRTLIYTSICCSIHRIRLWCCCIMPKKIILVPSGRALFIHVPTEHYNASGASQRTANRFHSLQNNTIARAGSNGGRINTERTTHKGRRSRTVQDGQLFGRKRESRDDQRPKWDKQENDDRESDRS